MSPRASWIATLLAVSTLAAVPALAEVTTNMTVPTDFLSFVPCTNGGAGEDVRVTGDLHIVISVTLNGNHSSAKAHFQPQGLEGVGLVTGTKYHVVGVTQERASFNLNNFGGMLELVNNFRLIAQGQEPNFSVHQVGKVTVNANGFATSFVAYNSFVCH